jgi:hypothetical protein
VSKPKPIGVDHVRLAVVGDLLDPTGVEVGLHLRAVDPVGFVPAPRLCGLLKSQRQATLHHQCGEEDLDRGWVLAGRSDAGGHSNLRTTQRYIEANPKAQVRVVELV